MEYKDRIPVKRYRPLFGYGYDPEYERKKKNVQTAVPDGRQTMPLPADSPLATLIAVLILWLAFLIGAIVATSLENREMTWMGPAPSTGAGIVAEIPGAEMVEATDVRVFL